MEYVYVLVTPYGVNGVFSSKEKALEKLAGLRIGCPIPFAYINKYQIDGYSVEGWSV